MSFVSTYSAASIRAWQSPLKVWTFYDDITKPSNVAGTRFGLSTATDENGNYIVVGSANSGVITIASGSSFSTIQTISPSYANNRIGLSVATNFNGDVIVGTDSARSNVTIFNRTGNSWSQTQVISVPLIRAGRSCSIDGTGNYIAVSSNLSGLVYSNTANVWSLQQTLTICNTLSANVPVVLNNDGTYLATGDSSGNGGNGQARIFTRSGSTWTLQANIGASSPATGTEFGSEVSINNNADVLMVGAPTLTVSGNTGAGGVYVYNRTGNSWSQTQLITPSDSAPQQSFGGSIQLDATGNYAIIGAYAFDGSGNVANNQGKVYFFENINNNWQQIQAVQSPNIANSEFFGESVSLSKNNYIAVVGASGNDVPNVNVGASYIYINS